MIRKRKFDGKFIEFPLCFLIYVGGKPERLNDIIIFYLIECAYRSNKEIDLNERIAGIAKEYNCQIGNYDLAFDKYKLLNVLFAQRIQETGAEPYCRIGKNVLFETIEGKFRYEHFAFLCGLSSILGKTCAYKKISRERLSYAMIGYKSKDNFRKGEKGNLKPPADWTIGRIADLLHQKKFFVKYTYHRKQTYYSTKLESIEKLAELVMEMKLRRQEMRLKTKHIELSNMIDKRLEEQRENHMKIYRLGRKVKEHTDVKYLSS
jgi:hypothetical protein